MWIQKKNKNLSFFPPLLPTVQKQQQFKQHKLANLCKTMIIRKTCVFVAELLGFMLLHDDWTLTTKWDLCKKSIPTWSLDYREAIDTPTWYLIGKNFFYVNQFGACHAFLMNFRPLCVCLGQSLIRKILHFRLGKGQKQVHIYITRTSRVPSREP